MIDARVADADDLFQLDIRPEQPSALAHRRHMAEQFERLGESWTFTAGGRVLVVAGLMQMWPGRALAWSVVADHRPWREMMAVGAEMRRLLAHYLGHRYHRIEAYADAEPLEWWLTCDWWLRRLGFNEEGRLSRFTQDGRDQMVYARVRHDG